MKREDRHNFTVVTHRGQEESSVALMGFKGSPPYVQRQMDLMLQPLQDFVKAYINDMIIFSMTLEEHIQHVCQQKRISLSPEKSFLAYPSVVLLGQRVDSLGFSTTDEKIKAITSLTFS